MMRRVILVVMVLLVLSPLPALAQEMSRAPMVRNRITWRTGRSELKPAIGWTLNDRYFHNVIINAGYTYHILDWLGIGANVGYAFPIMTGLAENIEAEKKREGLSFPIPASHLGLLADAHVELSDGGKAMLWGRASMAYDFHLILGFGVVQVKWNLEAESRFDSEEKAFGFKPSPKVGLGFRVFLDDGVAVTFDIIDHMAYMHTAAKVSEDYLSYTFPRNETFIHNVSAMLSFSIMMPYLTGYED